MNLIATQFTPIYDEREDRIRLIFNINYPTRYDMWITRNFLIQIVTNIYELNLEPPITYNNVSSNKTNSSDKEIYPFEKTILLLENIRISPRGNKFFVFFSDNRQTIESELTKNDLSNLFHHIINQVKYKWGIMF